jgi:hypothetical protein
VALVSDPTKSKPTLQESVKSWHWECHSECQTITFSMLKTLVFLPFCYLWVRFSSAFEDLKLTDTTRTWATRPEFSQMLTTSGSEVSVVLSADHNQQSINPQSYSISSSANRFLILLLVAKAWFVTERILTSNANYINWHMPGFPEIMHLRTDAWWSRIRPY